MLIVSSSAFRRPSVGVFQKFLLTTQVAASSSSSSQVQDKIHLYHNDMYKVQLPDSHKFPMDKYTHVREMISGNPAFQGKIVFKESPLALVPELETTHHPDYIERFLSGNMSEREIRVSGFPWTQKGVNRALSSVGGTVAAMRTVMNSSHNQSSNGSGGAVAAHLAGGTHHAMPDRAEGFCIFSDIAVAANLALQEYPELQRVLIIDLDVHQGNGNAVIFQDDERVFTFSMHCEGNIFSKKAKSDLDVDLPNGMTDDEYLAKLKGWLTPFLMDVVKPGLVFYQAGVDVSEHDRLGKLKISRAGLRRRNELLYNAVKRRGIPLVLTMGGGYPKDLDPHSEAFINLIGAHADCYSQLIETFSPP
jgi:acetoin utilization deacetylase AcuC-like enzyme